MSSLGSALPYRNHEGCALLASGLTDPGLQREVNEDRFHCDPAHGLFMVIDGVGGQAAGGKAADVALATLRKRLDAGPGDIGRSLREAIASANNEIYRLASTRAEWDGMACVLTIAVVQDGKVAFGHVGDTRLYKLRGDYIEKLTRDHSPVGEREDANEISERQAMLHPRRNEVYRDVGSELHDSIDRNFIDVGEVSFEPDAALLLCSDGLTDLVDSASIARTVAEFAGDPDGVVQALVRAANTAGGRDNVTIVYCEGDRFAASGYGRTTIRTRSAGESDSSRFAAGEARPKPPGPLVFVRLATIALVVGLAIYALVRQNGWRLEDLLASTAVSPEVSAAARLTVAPTDSIAAAMQNAGPGSEVLVEPGEYREQITLKPDVRLVSRVSRGATIRLPATVPDAANVAAVLARNVSGAELVGFRISGDSATPLPVGIFVQNSTVSIVDVEISGAGRAAIEFTGGGTSKLMASDIQDNAGAAMVVRDGDAPQIAHNSFSHNATSGQAQNAFVVENGAMPVFLRNVFLGLSPAAFGTLDDRILAALKRDNWFLATSSQRSDRAPAPGRASARR